MSAIEGAFAQLGAINAAQSADDLLETFATIVCDLGGSGFSVGTAGAHGAGIKSHSRNMGEWPEFYLTSGLYRDCPAMQRLFAATAPFHYEDMALEPGLTDANRRVIEAGRAFGLNAGLIVPMHGRMCRRGWVGIVYEYADADPQAELILAMLSMAVFSELESIDGFDRVGDEALSPREVQVMSWLASGKSAEDTGNILGISAATVMYHYSNVAQRYGTVNRTQTVVEALRRGVLSLD